MQKTLLTLVFTCFAALLFGQGRNCPSVIDLGTMQTQNPARYQRFMNLEAFTANYIANQSSQSNANARLMNPNGIISIPVVVHVLHRGEAIGTGRNISLAQIQSQIDVLNEDFRRLNANQVNTPGAFSGVASDYNLEFRLACQDPNGNPSDGIIRRFTNRNNFTFVAFNDEADENAMGIKMSNISGSDPWPTDRYLNIWVCDFGDGTLGYATFPGDFAAAPNVDGVVIHTTAMGRTGNVVAPFHLGRTATHEVGHWLNLFHIWGDAFCGDDQVADTPQQQAPNFGCPSFPKTSCSNGPNGDMFMNYMDYSDDACMNLYTNGQRLRGRALFAPGGPRAIMAENYFRIQPPTASITCTGNVALANPNCFPVTWSIVSGSATITASTNFQATISSATPGNVTVRATGGNYISEQVINIIVNSPAPANGITVYGNRFDYSKNGPTTVMTVCASENINLYPSLPVPVADVIEHQWEHYSGSYQIFSGGNYYGAYTYTSATPGTTLILRYRYRNSCGWSNYTYIELITMNCDAGEEPERAVGGGELDFTMSPNPANSTATITTSGLTSDYVVKILDPLSSKTLKSKQYNKKHKQIALDLADLKEGMYVVQIINNRKVKSKHLRVVK